MKTIKPDLGVGGAHLEYDLKFDEGPARPVTLYPLEEAVEHPVAARLVGEHPHQPRPPPGLPEEPLYVVGCAHDPVLWLREL